MDFTFVDRQSAYPNRFKLTPENGTSYYVTMERADSPIVEGTPLNAATFNAMVAFMIGEIVDDVLAALPTWTGGSY